ncbi:amino acid permease [Hyphomonas sp. FCG-A18]|uniref:amino acid permease n=1 Tax=Hyphomonas sp. FCG-A18 TaxID=3080019 RepID=UPI002B2EFE77|nr:amino acid permease [Hyphomonas sp. FCG-A18]
MANDQKLKKNLTLFDVYAVSTGAMFSSGFFLLPGIAAGYTGDSVYLAYLIAGVLILPAMFCMGELSTAMPKAGGTYYFLDRALGPLFGTIGGLGSWVAVIFKSAFALVGMGAYLSLYIDVPIIALAVILTIVFGLINAFGAKETTVLQRVLVGTLVIILAAFTILGLSETGITDSWQPNGGDEAFFSAGFVGFISTIGLVFVSYAGLTKVASVAEEIQNPDRNIPLGMVLSLITATAVYTLGTLVIINLLPPAELHNSLTPVADAGEKFLGWVPYDFGIILIVVAAIAAFASTGNAGILSASRYPFAMAKDKLMPKQFSQLGSFGTPTFSIMVTVAVMIGVILLFDVEAVAKLASAFQLLLFGLVCLAVIVMRESRIASYKPGFRSPFYPWTQVVGILISFWLIVEMGILSIGFTGMLTIACAFWYQFYASGNMQRRGAIFHVHERLGQMRYEGLERELMTIIHDRTQDQNLSYENLIARCVVHNYSVGSYSRDMLVEEVKNIAHSAFDIERETLNEVFATGRATMHPLSEHVVLAYRSNEMITRPELVVFRFSQQTRIAIDGLSDVHTVMVLLCPRKPAGLDLRLAGHLAEVVQSFDFDRRWLAATSDKDMNEILMRDDHFLHAPISDFPYLEEHVGKPLADFDLPESCLIAIIERDGNIIIAAPKEVLQPGDLVAVIGEPDDLARLKRNDF